MKRMKNILNKIFSNHDTGTAGFMVAILLAAVMMSCIFLNDWYGRGNQYADEAVFNIGTVCVFLGAAGATYIFGAKKKVD